MGICFFNAAPTKTQKAGWNKGGEKGDSTVRAVLPPITKFRRPRQTEGGREKGGKRGVPVAPCSAAAGAVMVVATVRAMSHAFKSGERKKYTKNGGRKKMKS